MDAERNTVVPVPSVYPSVCPVLALCQNVWTSSHFFEGHHSIFSSPTTITKLQGNPMGRAFNTRGGKIFQM